VIHNALDTFVFVEFLFLKVIPTVFFELFIVKKAREVLIQCVIILEFDHVHEDDAPQGVKCL